MKILIYDIEIIRGIVKKGESKLPGVEYCAGWGDHANMGISVIGALWEGRPRVFLRDNWIDFTKCVDEADLLVTFNGVNFDDKVIGATIGEMPLNKSYDILVEAWAAAGLGPTFQYPSHAGFSLDVLATLNLGEKKTGSGEMAPVLWQRGQIGAVIDYCMNDVHLTQRLFHQIVDLGQLLGPRGLRLEMKAPVSNEQEVHRA